MNTDDLDLKTLEQVRDMFNIHSDMSTMCNGYNTLCRWISEHYATANIGWWNGEKCFYKPITYEVTTPEKPTWWQALHVGKRRQALEITYGDSVFIIDNEHGDGYTKITQGLGSPSIGHKSVDEPINVEYISLDSMYTKIDLTGLQKEQQQHDDFIAENFPEIHVQIGGLRAAILDAQYRKP